MVRAERAIPDPLHTPLGEGNNPAPLAIPNHEAASLSAREVADDAPHEALWHVRPHHRLAGAFEQHEP